jgi:cobyrinic acid a,c-diamide synthase
VQPDEVEAIESVLDRIAEQLVFDADAWDGLRATSFEADDAMPSIAPSLHGKTIAVARDAAFAFVYPANLDCLRALGAGVEFFSPLANQPVPSIADAVYLPGGYPELHAQTLSQASRWQDSMRAVHAAGMPILAECGGLMTVADTLTDPDGVTWPMAGLLHGHVRMQSRLAALGLQGWTTPQGELRGHAFHYSRFETPLAPVAHARKHPSAEAGEAVYRNGALTASYFHGYFPSCPAAVAGIFAGSDKT